MRSRGDSDSACEALRVLVPAARRMVALMIHGGVCYECAAPVGRHGPGCKTGELQAAIRAVDEAGPGDATPAD